MAKALTRIKVDRAGHAKKAAAVKGEAEKHEFIEVGDDVPDEIAEAHPYAVDGEVESVIDPDDNESYAGEDAANESILMRPDNPNRPANIKGEEEVKVRGKGKGKGTSSKAAKTQHKESAAPDGEGNGE